jgi:hypothetical protein
MRADIHDGPEHNTLQSEAGYIDARPLCQVDETSCNARPDHTSGSIATETRCPRYVRFSSDSDHIAEAPTRRKVPTAEVTVAARSINSLVRRDGIAEASPAVPLWKSCFAQAVDINLRPSTGYSGIGLNLKELGYRLPSLFVSSEMRQS